MKIDTLGLYFAHKIFFCLFVCESEFLNSLFSDHLAAFIAARWKEFKQRFSVPHGRVCAHSQPDSPNEGNEHIWSIRMKMEFFPRLLEPSQEFLTWDLSTGLILWIPKTILIWGYTHLLFFFFFQEGIQSVHHNLSSICDKKGKYSSARSRCHVPKQQPPSSLQTHRRDDLGKYTDVLFREKSKASLHPCAIFKNVYIRECFACAFCIFGNPLELPNRKT